MKKQANIVLNGKKPFQPFTLSIQVNSLDEMRELYHRLNAAPAGVVNHTSTGVMDLPSEGMSTVAGSAAYDQMEHHARENGLR